MFVFIVKKNTYFKTLTNNILNFHVYNNVSLLICKRVQNQNVKIKYYLVRDNLYIYI